MSLDMVQVCIAGYTDRLLDEQLVAVQTGYWTAYYLGSKHPRSVKKITEGMIKEHHKNEDAKQKALTPKPDVDVEAFLAMEEQFKARLLDG